ncbi:MAG: hypothetical protein ACLTXM_07515 [Enterococcus sp.]
MYPDQIQYYTTEQQFMNHQKMLDEMKAYFRIHSGVSNPTLENLRREEKQLKRLHTKWLKNQKSFSNRRIN